MQIKMRVDDQAAAGCAGGGCLIVVGIVAFHLTVGALLFQYCLWSVFAKDAPWYLDMVGGLFLAEPLVPTAVVCLILRACGVAVPFIH